MRVLTTISQWTSMSRKAYRLTCLENVMSVDANHEVRIHIDQKPYRSPNPTAGVDLYELGHVRAGYVLYKEIEGNREDKLILIDDPKIHLTEDEHFHSAEAPDKHDIITVNTDP